MTSNNSSNNSRIGFDFPSINLNFNSITEALNPFVDQLMATNKGHNRCKDIACQSCQTKFTVFKRKRTCFDCNMDFCNQCLNKDFGNDRKNHCKRCIVFNTRPLDRNALNSLKARDLKWFLAAKRIPGSQMCNEKGELIDLIIQTFSPQNDGSNTSEYIRRFDNYNTTENRNEGISPQNPTPEVIVINTNDEIYNNSSTNPLIDSQNSEQNETTIEPIVNQLTDEQRDTIPDISKIYFNIDDLESEEQLKELSVKQLKLILTRNFVDYKGCVEKDELLTKVERLWRDRQQNKFKNFEDISDTNLCKICMESVIDCVLLECGHMIACTNCGKRLSECPICRQYVVRAVHIFKS